MQRERNGGAMGRNGSNHGEGKALSESCVRGFRLRRCGTGDLFSDVSIAARPALQFAQPEAWPHALNDGFRCTKRGRLNPTAGERNGSPMKDGLM